MPNTNTSHPFQFPCLFVKVATLTFKVAMFPSSATMHVLVPVGEAVVVVNAFSATATTLMMMTTSSSSLSSSNNGGVFGMAGGGGGRGGRSK